MLILAPKNGWWYKISNPKFTFITFKFHLKETKLFLFSGTILFVTQMLYSVTLMYDSHIIQIITFLSRIMLTKLLWIASEMKFSVYKTDQVSPSQQSCPQYQEGSRQDVHATTLGTESCTKTQENAPQGCIWLSQVINCSHHESFDLIPWQSKWNLWGPKYLTFLHISPVSTIPPAFHTYTFVYH